MKIGTQDIEWLPAGVYPVLRGRDNVWIPVFTGMAIDIPPFGERIKMRGNITGIYGN